MTKRGADERASVDVEAVQAEAEGAPLLGPIPPDLARAVVNDLLREAGRRPLDDKTWGGWARGLGELHEEQLGMTAWLLRAPSLREPSRAALRRLAGDRAPKAELRRFFRSLGPLTAEMIRANRFRREETLRKWADALGLRISGEDVAASTARLARLDYRETMKEYARAEKARVKAAAERERRLAEAARREAEARGWRE